MCVFNLSTFTEECQKQFYYLFHGISPQQVLNLGMAEITIFGVKSNICE